MIELYKTFAMILLQVEHAFKQHIITVVIVLFNTKAQVMVA